MKRRPVTLGMLAVAAGCLSLVLRFVLLARQDVLAPQNLAGTVLGLTASLAIFVIVVRYSNAKGRHWRAQIDSFVGGATELGTGSVVAVAFLPKDVLDMLRTREMDDIRAGRLSSYPASGTRDRSGMAVVLTADGTQPSMWGFPVKPIGGPVELVVVPWSSVASIETGSFGEGLRTFDELVISIRGWRSPVRLIMLADLRVWVPKRRDPPPVAAALERLRIGHDGTPGAPPAALIPTRDIGGH